MSPFNYQELPPGRFTRLLKKIEDASDGSDVLRYDMCTFSLEEKCPDYAALSYTWGSPFIGPGSEVYEGSAGVVNVELSVEQGPFQTFQIGRNLYEGLLAAGRGEWDSWLWADAICINQSDLEEKTRHVSQMDVIYSSAKLVLIWLGEPDEQTRLMYDIYDGYAAFCEQYIRETGKAPLLETDAEFDAVCKVTKEKITDDMTQAVVAFFRRRYFGRAWVIQEFCLASKSKFMFGSKIFTFQRLLDVWSWLMTNKDVLTASWQGESLGNGNLLGLMFRSAEFFVQLGNFSDFRESGGPRGEDFVKTAREEDGSRSPRTDLYLYFEELMWRTRTCEATVGHDNIVALLGLINPYLEEGEAPIIVPDYTISVPDYYRYVATTMLQELPYLTTLAFLRPDNREAFPSLPSWCPNFQGEPRARGKYGVQAANEGIEGFVCFDAYPTRNEKNSKIHIDGDLLELSAVYLDGVISSAALSNSPFPELAQPALPGELDICSFMLNAINDLGPLYQTGESIEAAVVTAATYTFHGGDAEVLGPLLQGFKSYVAYTLGASENEIGKLAQSSNQELYTRLKCCREQCLIILERLGGKRGCPTVADVKAAKEADERWEAEETSSETFQGFWERTGQQFGQVDGAVLGLTNAMIRTSKGYLGVTARSVRSGDELWLPCRGRVPLVLRPVAGRAGFYTVVGEAYVHGVMRGEMVHQGKVGEPGKVTLI